MPSRKKSGSKLEDKVARDLAALGLMDGCERQFKFHSTRKWLGDFCWPQPNITAHGPLMLEVNGGTYMRGKSRGAHSRPVRQRQDMEKWSTASIMGWTLILVDSADVRQGVHVQRVLEAMGKL